MRQVLIQLSSPDRIQAFVQTLSALDGEFELLSGRHILDARSLMGLFSLDLSRPVPLKVYNDCAKNLEALAPYSLEEAGHEE